MNSPLTIFKYEHGITLSTAQKILLSGVLNYIRIVLSRVLPSEVAALKV